MITDSSQEASLLVAQLLTYQYLPRTHPRVRRALADTELFDEVQQRLAQVGLRWVDNIYAEHVTLSLTASSLNTILDESSASTCASHNNLDLPRDAVALLVVLWAQIILPKRERQASRVQHDTEQQNEMFAGTKPMPRAKSVSQLLSYKALLEDYGSQLGKKMRLDVNLKLLERHGFITRSQDSIGEGPMLDVLLDYDILAPRILNGALGDVLLREKAQQEAKDKQQEPNAATGE
jgi:hypothetical protein